MNDDSDRQQDMLPLRNVVFADTEVLKAKSI
jgi:hypothetical protein